MLFVKRALRRAGNKLGLGEMFFTEPREGFNPIYNEKTVEAVEILRSWQKRRPFAGPFRQDDLDALWEISDLYGRWLYRTYVLPKPKPPALIAPNQGFASLHRSMWRVYSEGRRRGFTDLGTWNPASRLPSGRPSDHSVYPAYAIDFGIDPDTGWNNLKARMFAIWLVKQPEVEYVILGDRIWTSWRQFWGRYRSGGHMNHIHVSGVR